MVVEERRWSRVVEDGAEDRFPEGMRVLAVDDDAACLKLLGTLLRKCRYDVTTTNQSIEALRMLRENKNKFDLIISDVQMPDMDGFKLLELVGLEMDLPVIMLSAHGDIEFVMKGITHGACDYLLKPVRIEELRIIWQHVIRKKKVNHKDQIKSPTHGIVCYQSGEGGQGAALNNSADHNDKNGKKRKEQKEEDEDEDEENAFESDNGDSSTQKKPRVVWSVELHRKFVAAVNQLGIDKAFPKRILDLMNVEGLTRENVASHLQKYRLYLKRLSSVPQASMMAAMGSPNPSFIHPNSLNSFADLHALPSYAHGCTLGGLNNTPAGFSLPGHSPSHGILLGHGQNSSNPIITSGKLHPVVLTADQTENIFTGIPASLQLERNCLSQIGNFSHIDDEPSIFSVSDITPGTGLGVGKPSNPLLLQGSLDQRTFGTGIGVSSNSQGLSGIQCNFLPPGKPFHTDPLPSKGLVSNIYPAAIHHSLDQGTFGTGIGVSSNSPDFSRIQCNALPPGKPFHNVPLPSKGSASNISSAGPHISSSSVSFKSSSLEGLRDDKACQDGLLGNVVQSVYCFPRQKQEENTQAPMNSFNLFVPSAGVVGSLSQVMDGISFVSDRNMHVSLAAPLSSSAPPAHPNIETNEGHLFEKAPSEWL